MKNENRVSLRELIEVHYGKALKANARNSEGEHAVYGSNGVVGRHDEAIVESPTVMIGRKGSVGAIHFAPLGGWPIDTTYHVEIKDPQRLTLRYLFYALKNARLDKYAISTSIPGLNRNDLYSTKILLPTIAVQERIASVLDKADAIRHKRKDVRDRTNDFLRAQFVELFGDAYRNPKNWPTKKLEELSQLQSGVTKGRKLEGKKTVDVPYMRVWNVQDAHLRLGDIKNITVLETDVEKYRLETGDLLLTEGGDPDQLGRGAIWYSPIPVCIHQNHIFRVRANRDLVVPEFLSAMIGSEFCKRYFLKMAKQTTGIASINMRQLKACPVLLPPLKLQEKFSQIEKRFKQSAETLDKRFEEADTLFDSIAQKAFSGEL